jgi:hypothetical protein
MFALAADSPAADGSSWLTLAGAIRKGCVSPDSPDGPRHGPSQQPWKMRPGRVNVHCFAKLFINFIVDYIAKCGLKRSSTI